MACNRWESGYRPSSQRIDKGILPMDPFRYQPARDPWESPPSDLPLILGFLAIVATVVACVMLGG